MPNVLWYYITAAIGCALLIFTFIRKRPFIDLLAFFLASAAFAYMLEVVVLFVFRAYDYKPGIFPDPIAEDIFGHLLCNGLFWGGFIMFVTAFSLRFYWVIAIAAFFMAVEVFYIQKGLYVHYWWRTIYTGVGAFIILMALKKWYGAIRSQQHVILRSGAFVCIAWLLLVGPTIVLLDAGKQHSGIGVSQNYYLDDIYFEAPFYLLLSGVTSFFVIIPGRRYWKAIPFIAVLAADSLLTRFDILTYKDGWCLFYLMECRALCLLFFIVLEKHAFRNRQALSAG